MTHPRCTAARFGATAAVLGTTALLAACGSSTKSSASATRAASATTARASGATATVATGSGPAGTYLTGAGGRALYLWDGDRNGRSRCSGACASTWPPLLSRSAPVAVTGARASALGTIARGGGKRQVTYRGHPLYYFAGDHGTGATTGQGSDSFGARWWLVDTAGAAITAKGAVSSSSASSAAGGGY